MKCQAGLDVAHISLIVLQHVAHTKGRKECRPQSTLTRPGTHQPIFGEQSDQTSLSKDMT